MTKCVCGREVPKKELPFFTAKGVCQKPNGTMIEISENWLITETNFKWGRDRGVYALRCVVHYEKGNRPDIIASMDSGGKVNIDDGVLWLKPDDVKPTLLIEEDMKVREYMKHIYTSHKADVQVDDGFVGGEWNYTPQGQRDKGRLHRAMRLR